jgi:hypothetical protein
MMFFYVMIMGLAVMAAKNILDVRHLALRYTRLLKDRAAQPPPKDDPA